MRTYTSLVSGYQYICGNSSVLERDTISGKDTDGERDGIDNTVDERMKTNAYVIFDPQFGHFISKQAFPNRWVTLSPQLGHIQCASIHSVLLILVSFEHFKPIEWIPGSYMASNLINT